MLMCRQVAVVELAETRMPTALATLSDDQTRAYEQVLELTHSQVKSPTPGA